MKVIENVDLRPFNTLQLPAIASRYCEAASVDDLRAALAANGEGRVLILGGGSNVVLAQDFDGLVLRPLLRGRELLGDDGEYRHVRVGAGESWADAVAWTLEQGWGGLENLSLIPGLSGAAPIQNIGAYGVELEAVLDRLEALDLVSGEVREFTRAECRFGYRDSVFKRELAGRVVITALRLKLPLDWQPRLGYRELADALASTGIDRPSPRDVADAVIALRQRKLPDWRVLGNAGSFFKNPVVNTDTYATLRIAHPGVVGHQQSDGSVKLAAGWLIEQAGWKGRDLGRVGMYERQALVLVNRGGATGAEVLALRDAVRASVHERFGVDLEPEPLVV
ncbi:UDP-N-acetylmuramate dehydrogenase [Derxia gummosa]|uniref:UDP-N-acetylenolpyruvoylglucosamine reductase n=1 Tax=Derxia gummosa DSM 723 TaxID=1121388 RepID=A0A8B6X860_9BURK|nr:UDP-N-acetylmuramate dehydrogenase [Derxia gummosa]